MIYPILLASLIDKEIYILLSLRQDLHYGEVVYGMIIVLDTLDEVYAMVIIDVEGSPCL